MANSTHKVEVFRVEHLEKHPNADTLNIMRIFDSYQVVVRMVDFKVGDLACYIPPDNIVPDKPEYAFLKGSRRIKATKLRGIVSQGLVLPAPEGHQVGDDIAELLEIEHYIPPAEGAGDAEGNPPVAGENYDIDSWFRYSNLMEDGMPVEMTEKIHGTNTRASYQEGRFWMGSRSNYRKPDPNTTYWRVFHKNQWLQDLCQTHPGYVVYGETYGNVQDLKYGHKTTEDFRVFDIWTGTRYLNYDEKVDLLFKVIGSDWMVNYVPILYVGPYSKEKVQEHMNGMSTVPKANHVREGVVIKPLIEKWSPEIGRLVLKAVSPDYLARA